MSAASQGGSALPMPKPPRVCGVEIAGTALHVPSRMLSNKDLEGMMDTSDEWITQRTGIKERHVVDPAKGESATTLSAAALQKAMDDAGVSGDDLDLVIVATVSMEMACPSTSCRVAALVGAGDAGAFDLTAACCGFVYSMNLAHDLIRSGSFETIGVVGCDVLSEVMEYNDHGRSTAIIFGDGAGAAVFRATDDLTKGVIAQSMHANGERWEDLYIPRHERDFPERDGFDPRNLGLMIMRGKDVFRFAVKTFPEVIEKTLADAGVSANDVSMYICHQSNARILEAARERFGLPSDKLYVNIDRFGNTSAASVPICLHELREAGRIGSDELVMFVAFGGGLTWGSSLWRV
jgi:3-oxoacyl-[acyl-carrier-protein] synthase-3